MSEEPNKSATRDQSEPTASRVPVPVCWLIALVLMAFWGFGYLDRHAGGFEPKVYGPFPSKEFVAGILPPVGGDNRFELGRRLYVSATCWACHQLNGMGNPSGNIPPLAGSDWVNAEGPNRIIRIVLFGFSGPVEVSGKPYNGGAMTPFANLTDDEIAAILTYVRGNKEWGNNADPVSAGQVAKIRSLTKDRPAGVNWAAPDLLAIPVKD